MKKIVIIDDEYFFRQALIKYVRSFKDEFTVVVTPETESLVSS